ncbi:MAG: VanZ family protein [Coriobacteriaceae bacterium]
MVPAFSGGVWYMVTYIIGDVLTSIYQPFLFALTLTVFVMFFFVYTHEHGWSLHESASRGARTWIEAFRTSKLFRIEFLLVLFVVLVLFKTLYSRDIWFDPLSDVLGGWGLYDRDGKFTAEAVENFILFVPFGLLLSDVLCRRGSVAGTEARASAFMKSVQASALLSLFIECSQLLFHLGTFQLSDLAYNTAGGLVGAGAYYLVSRRREGR